MAKKEQLNKISFVDADYEVQHERGKYFIFEWLQVVVRNPFGRNESFIIENSRSDFYFNPALIRDAIEDKYYNEELDSEYEFEDSFFEDISGFIENVEREELGLAWSDQYH